MFLKKNSSLLCDFGVARRLHMASSRIREIAHFSKAKKVVLSHFMNRIRNKKGSSVEQIKRSFQGDVKIANDFECYHLSSNY